MLALKEEIEKQRVSLESHSIVNYTGPAAERAVTFPAPGGLLDTAERFIPGLRRVTRKIEGPHTIYPYLESVAKIIEKPGIEFPLLIDCLNCEMGCIGGPGTGNDVKPLDELESPIRKRSRELEKQLNPREQERLYKKYHALLNNYWKPDLYDRKYQNLSENYNIKEPNEKELPEVYKQLKKNNPEDILNCTACGYLSCKKMATAIFNNLNKVGSCAHYTLALLDEERRTIKYINQHIKARIDRASEGIRKINDFVEKLSVSINTQSESVDESSAATEKMVNSIKSTSELSRQKRESILGLIENASKGKDAMKETVLAVKNISESVDGIAGTIKIISVIASNTNLLAMNAAIESAHAGEAGKGFAVVADEIRRLSETTRDNSRNISQTLSSIIAGINATSNRTSDTGDLINNMSTEINGFASTMSGLIDTLSELSAESSGITSSLKSLQSHSAAVKSDYTEMLALTDILKYEINYLSAMSADIVRAIEEGDQDIINRLVAKEKELGNR
jgi:archaellum component FlaC